MKNIITIPMIITIIILLILILMIMLLLMLKNIISILIILVIISLIIITAITGSQAESCHPIRIWRRRVSITAIMIPTSMATTTTVIIM